MLHNILACLRKRHSEPHRGFHLETQLAVQNARGALGILLDHLVHVLGGTHWRHVEQHVRRPGRRRFRHLAVQLEQLCRVVEEARARPVALDVVVQGHREQRPLALGLGQRLPGGEHGEQAERRGPLRAAGVDQDLLLRRPRAEARRRTGRTSGRRMWRALRPRASWRPAAPRGGDGSGRRLRGGWRCVPPSLSRGAGRPRPDRRRAGGRTRRRRRRRRSRWGRRRRSVGRGSTPSARRGSAASDC